MSSNVVSRIRYRVVVKVLCEECFSNKKNNKSQKFNCSICKFLRYNNVTNLLTFQRFLDTKYINWDWWKVYTYIKGETDNTVLITFKNYHKRYVKNSSGNWVFNGVGRDIPTKKNL